MAVERLIGVDFGTSTSVIRVKRYENGTPVGEKLETKDVTFDGDRSMVPTLILRNNTRPELMHMGHDAKSTRKGYTQFHSFKMDLESSDPALRAQARVLTEAFYSYLARQYRSQSDGGHLGESSDTERTIISYPVKWSDETKNFMLETAKKAGFPNVTGMDEAQAAIQAVIVMSTDHLQRHGLLTAGESANILLIDMGAGTTDLVLARYTPGEQAKTEVLNIWPKGGEILFGGRQIDALLQNFFREKLDEEDAQMVFRRIGTDKFKSWKEETVSGSLRRNEPVWDFEALDNYVEDMGIDLEEYRLDRTALEDCLADYLVQFPELVNGCLADAGMSGRDVDLVIVTGGHSQWYFVSDMLCGKMPRFGHLDLPRVRENPARIIPITRPQETVALGLAYSGIHFDLSTVDADPAPEKTKLLTDLTSTLQAVQHPKQTSEEPKQDEAPVIIPIEFPEEIPDVPERKVFRLEYEPVNNVFNFSGKGTVVVGSITEGEVKLGDVVYVCGAPGQSRSATVANISLHPESKIVPEAQKGQHVALLLSGIPAMDVNRGTYLSDEPDICDIPTANTTVHKTNTGAAQFTSLIEAAGKTAGSLLKNAQQAADQHRQHVMEEARRKAEAARIDLANTPYAPESEFDLISSGSNYVIKKYLGTRPIVSIPPMIRGRSVIAIGDYAFGGRTLLQGNRSVEMVVIPNTVTTIGRNAFAGCTGLHTVIAHNRIEQIGDAAFWACDNLQFLDFGMGKPQPWRVTFPTMLKRIGASAFRKSVTFNDGIFLKEVMLSRRTKVVNPLGGKTFPPGSCSIFYYD